VHGRFDRPFGNRRLTYATPTPTPPGENGSNKHSPPGLPPATPTAAGASADAPTRRPSPRHFRRRCTASVVVILRRRCRRHERRSSRTARTRPPIYTDGSSRIGSTPPCGAGRGGSQAAIRNDRHVPVGPLAGWTVPSKQAPVIGRGDGYAACEMHKTCTSLQPRSRVGGTYPLCRGQ
jgi:hypothetical protein